MPCRFKTKAKFLSDSSSLEAQAVRIELLFVGLLDSDVEGASILRNVRNQSDSS